MFDLNKAIQQWRQQLAKAGTINPELLDELEGHLRDDIERRMHEGLNSSDAFDTAVRELGSAETLRTEFEKVHVRTLRNYWAIAFKSLAAVSLLSFILVLVSQLIPQAIFPALGLIGVAILVGSALMAWQKFKASSDDSAWITVLTPASEESLAIARREAPRFGHDFVGTEHLLLGLISAKTGAIPDLMRTLGIERHQVKRQIDLLVGIGANFKPDAEIPYTPRAKRALELSAQHARNMQCDRVNPEHILLGLLQEGSGVAAIALKNLGLDRDTLRIAVLKQLKA